MDNCLQNSVARVLGSADPNASAGTAFLFAKSDDQQLWMTCHHVIRALSSLKLAVYVNNKLTEIGCDYYQELSSPSADVAVLQTKLTPQEISSLGLLDLPLGDPFASNDYGQWSLIGCGIQGKVERYPRGVPFAGKFSVFHDAIHDPLDNEELTRQILALGNPWNIPFAARTMRLYEFRDETNRLEPGFSGSPICISPQSRNDIPMCVGMLNARRSDSVSRHGFVIPFDVIDSACRHRLPFHRYASCVVVVLAAKQDELKALSQELNQEILNRVPNYHAASRDEWHPFGLADPTIKDSLNNLSSELPSWQLASDYLDWDDGRFRHYLEGRQLGPLVYIVDPCSTTVDTIRAVAKHVSDTSRGARYVYALCDTINTSIRAEMKKQLREYLGGQFWEDPHSERLDSAEDLHGFRNRIRLGMKTAYERFMVEYPAYPSQRAGGFRQGETPFRRMDWSGPR